MSAHSQNSAASADPTAANTRLGLSAGVLSILVASALVGLKLWALAATGALSVAASLADSAMDLVMSLLAAFAIVYAARPADDDHAFGHSSVEDLIALGQSLFIAASALLIGWTAVARLVAHDPPKLEHESVGILVMSLSILLTVGLVLWQGYVAKRTGSKVVAADRLHYIGDLLPAIGAIGALALSKRLGISGIDSLVALLAACVMVFGASHIGKSAWDALMDRSADAEMIRELEEMTRNWPGVRGFHDLKSRTAGSRVFVNLHIELDGDQSLTEAHAIGAGLRRAMRERFPELDVIIHKDVAESGEETHAQELIRD